MRVDDNSSIYRYSLLSIYPGNKGGLRAATACKYGSLGYGKTVLSSVLCFFGSPFEQQEHKLVFPHSGRLLGASLKWKVDDQSPISCP